MALNDEYALEIREVADAWQDYVIRVEDWHSLVDGVEPVSSGCGQIYEMGDLLGRTGEDAAIADMRAIPYAEPHYHPTGNWEFYIALQGTARVYVGGVETRMERGDALIIPPDTAHYTVPDDEFVIVVVNRPPFAPENYITLTASDPAVHFDHEQFLAHTHAA